MRLFLVLLATLALAGTAFADGRIGPDLRETGNGRLLAPAGRLTKLGDFPTGSALTPDGRFLWAVDSGHGTDDVQVVSVAGGQVVQTLPLPGAYGGVTITADGRHAYVSGEPKSTASPPPPDAGPVKGPQGDVVHVFDVDPASGRATERDPIALPSTSGGSGQQNSLPPVSLGWPEGLAVTPDGKTLVVALNQADKVAIVDLASGKSQLASVGAYPFGVAITPDGRTAVVSNEEDGTLSFVDLASAKQTDTLGVGGKRGDQGAHPEPMVVDTARGRLYVGVANRDLVAAVDLKTHKVVDQVSVALGAALGAQPVGLGLSPDDGTLYAADEGEDALAVIDLSGLSSPAAALPHATRVGRAHLVSRVHSVRFVARARSARRARGRRVRACAGPSRRQEAAYIRAVRRARHLRGRAHRRALARARGRLPKMVRCGTLPAGALAPPAAPPVAPMRLAGRIPTGAFPTDAKVTPDGLHVLWTAAKGFGSGPNSGYVFAGAKGFAGNQQTPYGEYVPDKLFGLAGTLATPGAAAVTQLSAQAAKQALPINARSAPPGSPLVTGGPIKHVFYVVRENRTYDQVFGTDPRGDGDPDLELFDDNGVPGATGGITPNAHALVKRFPLLDHFYSDSEVSVDGHLITAGSIAIDYDQRALHPNYSGRGRAFDFGIAPVSFGPNDFVFDQAVRQGVSFRDYGEQGAGIAPIGGSENRPTYPQVMANVDQAYAGNIQIGCLSPPAGGAQCTRDSSASMSGPVPAFSPNSRIDEFASQFHAQDEAGTVPTFNYLILPNDHTNGTTSADPTPQAEIADNDLALGQLVDLVSHSSVWASSAIIVVEDDSQDGADHVDAHRQPALVISPWATSGEVGTRYDQYSALHTAEILAGLKPLSINDGLATPMYDAFRDDGKPDTAAYTAVVPSYPLTSTNSSSSGAVRMSDALPFNHIDMVPQAISDRVLWASVHGDRSAPPPPGPNASPSESDRAAGALRLLRSGGNVRSYLARTEGGDG